MVNCTIKTEEKKESCYESPKGAAAGPESHTSSLHGAPPSLRDTADSRALPQVEPNPLVLSILTAHRAEVGADRGAPA